MAQKRLKQAIRKEKVPEIKEMEMHQMMEIVEKMEDSEQLEIMEAAFNTNTYPDQDERERIAIKTGLSEDKIMTWFSNRRARCRKNFAFTGTNSLLIQNAAPISVMPRPSMRQSETVPLFPSQMNLLSYPVSPTSPVKFQDPSTAPILFIRSMHLYDNYYFNHNYI
ncbi:homeobox domain-containing protein [Wuchereria bancrofti]|uniref:Homeobox domain-containing protein n=1 Tax=Wuchereria bancrofti TaxID=6293 RepID=J9FDJ0_WUCBA|nr:homeobox domain-containing protein [Wuchereria bancrofti]